MKIKALSLWQPWASLVALRVKQYETRSWKTNYRGPLLICAAKGGLCTGVLTNLIEGDPVIQEALAPLLPPEGHRIGADYLWGMVWGAAVAVVDLTDCIKTELFKRGHPVFEREWRFGDFGPDRFAWKLENIRRIEPFTVKGRQQLFEVEAPLGGFKFI